MADSPHDLIRQLQIRSRAAAGLAEFNPNDPTLPSLPPLASTIAALDPSESDLRCVNCKGKLLGGIQSNICLYCGRRRQNDVVPDPICFTSTTAYQWLLRSLRLDGSEMVKPLTSKTEQGQGQSPLKAELPLSDFLNFKVAWAAETQKEETCISDQRAKESVRSLSLSGIPPDNFFFTSKKDASNAYNEEPIIQNQLWSTETNEVSAHDGPNLFQNIQSSDQVGTSLNDQSGEEFSEWQADFQFSNSGNQHDVSSSSVHFMGYSADSSDKVQVSETSDRFTGSGVDNSAQMDSVFGPGKDPIDGLPKDNQAASGVVSDWNLDESWNNLSSNKSQHTVGIDDIVISKDQTLENDDTCITESTAMSKEHEEITGDSFDDWNNFTGSSSLNDSSENVEIKGNDPQMGSVFATGEDPSEGLPKDNPLASTAFSDWNSDELWISSSNKYLHTEGMDGADKSKEDHRLENPNDLSTSVNQAFEGQYDNISITESMPTGKEDKGIYEDSFDEWNDFTGSGRLKDSSENIATESNDPQMNFMVAFEGQPKDNPAASTPLNGWNSDDFWSNLSSKKSQHPEGIDDIDKSKDDHALESPNDLATSFNEVFKGQNDNICITGRTPMNEEHKGLNEDTFDEWNEFTGPSSLEDFSENVKVESNDPQMDSTVSSGEDLCERQPKDSPAASAVLNDWNSDEWWNNLSSKKSQDTEGVKDIFKSKVDHTLENPNELSTSVNLSQDFERQNNDIAESTPTSEVHETIDEDSFDEWNDFTGSSTLQDSSDNAKIETNDSQMDFVFPLGKDPKPSDNSAASMSFGAWTSDEPWNNLSSKNSQQTKGLEDIVRSKDDQTVENPNDLSTSAHVFQDFEWKNDNTSVINSTPTGEEHKTINEDSFDEWNDFTGSSFLQDPSESVKIESHNSQMDTVFGPGQDKNHEQQKRSPAATTALSDWNSDELWNNLSSKRSQQTQGLDDIVRSKDEHTLENPTDLSSRANLFHNFEWQNSNAYVTQSTPTVQEHKMINEDSFDEWNDFTGSSSLPGPLDNVKIESNDSQVDSEFGLRKDPGNEQPKDSPVAPTAFSDWTSNELWSNLSSKRSQHSKGLNDIVTSKDDHTLENPNDLSSGANLFQDFEWRNKNASVTQSTPTGKEHQTINEDPFDEWNDFTGPGSILYPADNVKIESRESQVDAVFGLGKDPSNGQPKQSPGASTAFSDWTSDDLWNNLSSKKSQHAEEFDDIVKFKDDHNLEKSNDHSTSANLFQHFEWLNNNTYNTQSTQMGEEHKTITGDSFDEWNDFTSSSSFRDPSESV